MRSSSQRKAVDASLAITMTAYPEDKNDRRIAASELQSLVKTIFERCGMTQADASLLAETLVVADVRGCHSHGVLRVAEYVKKLTIDGVDPQAKPVAVRDAGSALVIDGRNAMGQIACVYAMRQAVERAEATGVAVAAVRGSNHCGAMAYFAMMALERDMIGLATTNALPTMAPWGGSDKIVGINPLAVAVPADRESPVVLDAAFSGSSHGKIRVYHHKGLAFPDGWALDRKGRPTTDAAAAIEGLLQPIGDYKGTGLAIIMGILASALSGARYGTELGDMVDGPKAGGDGQFLMAINVSAFEEPDRFKQRIDAIVRQIRASKRIAGVEAVYAPGGLEAETERRYRSEGIPLNAVTIDALVTCASEFGIDPRALSES